MRAVIANDQKLRVDDWPDPVPAEGQVLVKTLACGICGSDLHMLKHADHMIELGQRAGSTVTAFDPHRDLVYGHEFSAEILDHGPGTEKKFKTGTTVCSMPVVIGPAGAAGLGYSNEMPGGYGELMVLSEALLLEVPNGLSADHAALTEPMAVGAHAVLKGDVSKDDVALVIGCGPVGLAVIAGLKARGLGPVLAADFSEKRRYLAEAAGADLIINPGDISPYSKWSELGVPVSGDERALKVMLGETPKSAVIFECVGVKGVVQEIIEGAPAGARVVVAGVCMDTDHFEPALAIMKQMDIRFVLGYSPEEFAETLHLIAEGTINVEPFVTGYVGLDGVAQAFDDLASPDIHAKILIKPEL
jgi:threonine dehydrogenase-like Zn-dependent dehydrogenase